MKISFNYEGIISRNIMLKKILIYCSIVLLSYCFIATPALAQNNKVGIHILETSEVKKAAELVNSSGGDWGYVTIVLREDDLNKKKWQKFFDDCRRLHLIPIIRIATHMMPNGIWAKPNLEDLEKWPKFLNSLNWPVKQQIVVVFNEPNHAKEWGGEIDAQEYALVLNRLISLFKESNSNFFILPAGLDQAADGKNGTLDETVFLQEMKKAVPDIFNKLDGWNSHSYPNHGFVGSPEDKGRVTIRGYEWELEILRSLIGLKSSRDLKVGKRVYITETGWPHKQGLKEKSQFYKAEKVAEFFQKAFEVWQKDNRVQAVTPFVLNYPTLPFAHFSWLKKDGTHYQQFDKVLGMSKTKAEPEQVESYQVTKVVLTDVLPTDYLYKGKVTLKNTGQWIMGERSVFSLPFSATPGLRISEVKLDKGKLVFPGEEVTLDFTLKTGTQSAEHHLVLGNKEYTLYVFKPFDLKNRKVSLWRQIITKLKLLTFDLFLLY